MAGINGNDVVLIDAWPGPVDYHMSIPTNGFDSSREGSGNCVTEPLFDPGHKITAYNDTTTNPGWYTCIYLRFVEGSDYAYDANADPSSGKGLVCHLQDMTQHDPDVWLAWFNVTSDATNSCGTIGGAVAMAMRDLSGGADSTSGGRSPEWGWFWCGGVCPCNTSNAAGTTDYTKTGGNYPTDGSVVINNWMNIEGNGSNGIRFSMWDGTLPENVQAALALATDA